MCHDLDCFLPDEYWCEKHAGSEPLPQRGTFHDQLLFELWMLLGPPLSGLSSPQVYECVDHGGVIDEEFLRAAFAQKSENRTLGRGLHGLRKYAPLVGCILALLLAAFSRWPYGFYVLLRLGVCAVSVYWAVEMFKQKQTVWTWALGANAVLFNPVLPVHMARSGWEVVNLLDALFLVAWATASFYRERRRPHDTHSASGKNEP